MRPGGAYGDSHGDNLEKKAGSTKSEEKRMADTNKMAKNIPPMMEDAAKARRPSEHPSRGFTFSGTLLSGHHYVEVCNQHSSSLWYYG
jgi:hypothetical protein